MIDICKEVCPCNQCDTEPEECELAKAYRKQIPEQVIGMEAQMQNRYCPNCNEWMMFEKIGRVAYCPMCGKALKWQI